MAVDLKGASDALTQKSQLDQLEQAQKNAENKKQAEALKDMVRQARHGDGREALQSLQAMIAGASPDDVQALRQLLGTLDSFNPMFNILEP